MKKFYFIFALFCAFFLVSCGSGSSSKTDGTGNGGSSAADTGKLGGECYPNETCNKGLICDTENNLCVEDPENPADDSDKTDSDSDGETDTGSESDTDSTDSQHENQDSGNSEPDDDDSSDSGSDSGDSQPDNDADSGDSGKACKLDEAYATIEAEKYFTFKGWGKINNSLSSVAAQMVTTALVGVEGRDLDYASSHSYFYNTTLDDQPAILLQAVGDPNFSIGKITTLVNVYIPIEDINLMKKNGTNHLDQAPIVKIMDITETSDSAYQKLCFLATNDVDKTDKHKLGKMQICYNKNEDFSAGETFKLSMAAELTVGEDILDVYDDVDSMDDLCTCYDVETEEKIDCTTIDWTVVGSTRTSDCSSKPAKTVWNDNDANGKFTQTWDGTSWNPSIYTSSYNTDPGTCRFKCNSGYFWNDSECVDPCKNNPCEEVENSTHTCTASAWNEYICGCVSGYHWLGKASGCTDRKSLGSICTGQNLCYNSSTELESCPAEGEDFYGQDAQFTGKCTAQSFTLKTISDPKVVVDNNTGLTWEKSPSSDTYTWANRNTHCSELNNSNYGGKSNWRVPNPLELLTIVDNSRYAPAINLNYFTGIPTEDDSYFWTNNEYKGDTSGAYYFNPSSGESMFDIKTSTYKVLCVSGEEMKPAVSADFTTSSDGKTVTDNITGLMWQKEYLINKTWQQALAYCQSLNAEGYGGYSAGWRLPNKNEIASLVNYEKSAKPYSYFPDMPDMTDNYFWSSSRQSSHLPTLATWLVGFDSGSVSIGIVSNSHVRCVR